MSSPACVCFARGGLKYLLNFDDSLDVVGVHLVGGLVGCLVHRVLRHRSTIDSGLRTTVCSTAAVGRPSVIRRIGAFSVLAYSFIVPRSSASCSRRRSGSASAEDAELEGIDLTEHAESAYDFEGGNGGGTLPVSGRLSRPGRERETRRSTGHEARHRDHQPFKLDDVKSALEA